VVSVFASGILQPVDLDVAADGSLYYVAHGTGSVGRIRAGSGQPPGITQQPASTTRPVGQTASFSVAATGSQPLAYQWQRNGVAISGATAASYTTPALTTSDNGASFRAVVSNAFGSATSASATLTVTNDQPPTVAISTPPQGSMYSAGETIAYAGSASDAEDGTPPPSAFTWKIDFHHDTHTHPFMADTSGMTSGSFVVPTRGETSTNVWFRIYLTVHDSAGNATTVFRDVHPRVANLLLGTAPAGLQVTVDGSPLTTPASVPAVVGMIRSLGAVSPQSSGGTSYVFTSWSDGGAATHDVTVPASDTSFTASYAADASAPGAFLESGGLVVMEAEDSTAATAGSGAAAGSTFTLAQASGQSGSGVLQATPNAGVNTRDQLIGPRRDYAVRFGSAGTYYVWVRLAGATTDDDSVHAGLNGTAATLGNVGLIAPGPDLGWANKVGSARVSVNVAAAGVATVNLWMREDGVQVDRLLLTKAAAFTPTGAGPAESARQ